MIIRWVVFLLCLRNFKDHQCSQLPHSYLYLWLYSQVSDLSVHLSVWSPYGLFDRYLPFHISNMRSLKSPPSYPRFTNVVSFHLWQPKGSIHHLFSNQAPGNNPQLDHLSVSTASESVSLLEACREPVHFPLSTRRLWHQALRNAPACIWTSTAPLCLLA